MDNRVLNLSSAYDHTFDAQKWTKYLKSYEQHSQKVLRRSVIDAGETAKQKAERIAWLEEDYIRWFTYYLSHYAKVECADYHREFFDMVYGNKKSKTLAEIYRSGAKSVHANVGQPLFIYVKEHIRQGLPFFFLLIGETEPKARRLLGDIQTEFEHNQRFINDYGRKMSKGTWAEGDFLTIDGARFVSLGFGQSPRGIREGAERPTHISIDDVDTKKHVRNNVIMAEAVDYITGEVMGCFDASDNSIERLVYVNNNFHKNSITNRLKAEFKKAIQIDQNNHEETDYRVLTVCAVTDLQTFTPTWAAKTTATYWRKKYQKNPRGFLREYMHIHVEDGKIFQPEDMQWKDMLPLNIYDALIFVGDLSYKDKADYKGMYLIGKSIKEYHIIHSFLRQCSRAIVAEWVYDKYEERELAKYNIRYLIDGLFAQDGFVNDFDAEGELRGYYIPVEANKEKYGDKHNHIESTQGRFKRRWVWWNAAEKESQDQIETLDQYYGFEKGSQMNDDGPDAIGVGFKELDKTTFVEKFDPRIIARDNYVSSDY